MYSSSKLRWIGGKFWTNKGSELGRLAVAFEQKLTKSTASKLFHPPSPYQNGSHSLVITLNRADEDKAKPIYLNILSINTYTLGLRSTKTTDSYMLTR